MNRIIKTFANYKALNEAVVERGDDFIVGGIKVSKKIVNAFKRKFKDQTGKDVNFIADLELAEELLRWVVDNSLDIDKIPLSAITGIDEDMVEDLPVDTEEFKEVDTEKEDDMEDDEEFEIETDEEEKSDFELPTEESGDEEEDNDEDLIV